MKGLESESARSAGRPLARGTGAWLLFIVFARHKDGSIKIMYMIAIQFPWRRLAGIRALENKSRFHMIATR